VKKMAIQARKAERRQVKAKVALIGPSGAGKTYSALRLAKGFGGRTLLCNTEGDRGYLYADEFEYDIVDLTPPYSPERYIEVMEYAEKEGYSTLIVDSGSHEWAGRGGILETLDNMPGNSSFAKWKILTPRHNAFIDKMLYSRVHIINCLRAKDQYVVEENEKGKQQPKKVGVGAQQRDNYEYEFMVTLLIDQQSHIPTAMKDNTHRFEQRYEKLTEEDGKFLREWAELGVSAPAAPRPAPNPPVAAAPPAPAPATPPKQDDLPLNGMDKACHSCGIAIDDAVEGYSKRVYGQPLCRNCQKTATKAS
jgi:adenylate kinase family enzyme